MAASNPFVIGQWVRGKRFYGRAAQIEEILEGPRNWMWLLGTRRIGKTSLLKQIEHLADQDSRQRYFPVFWDFQGANTVEELHNCFRDALLDAGDRLDEAGISEESLEGKDLFESLSKLRRQLRPKKKTLLLLCDEVEELIKLNQSDPSILSKLRRAMQSREDVRSVLASTIRLWALSDQRGDTSPFLHGFTPPVYIRGLSDEEARALIRQEKSEGDALPGLTDDVIEEIRAKCDNHPYLLQLVCKRYLELGKLKDAVEEVASDQMVSHFFAVDFEMLSVEEQGIIRSIAETEEASSDALRAKIGGVSSEMSGTLLRLEHLGFIRRNSSEHYELVNYFFRRWFLDRPVSRPGASTGRTKADVWEMSTDQPTIVNGSAPNILDNRYELQEELGKGGMGIVYKAHDRVLGEKIAIKILRPEYAAREESLARFKLEVLLARDLGHPNILKVYDLGIDGDKKYMAMKFIDGPTLMQVVKRDGALEIRRAAGIAWKLASALEAAHAKGIVHRDIKPQNILMDAMGEPYLTDFGLARLMSAPGVTQSGVFLGTPEFASPEQARLRPTDARSDIYSLGLVIYQMLTGDLAFKSESYEEVLDMHRRMPPPDPRKVRPDLPERFALAVLRCLLKDPDQRFQDAQGLQSALAEFRNR